MRIIIIIQSLVTLLGAYYIYTLSYTVTVSETPPVMQVERRVPTTAAEYVPPATNPPAESADTASSSAGASGPNDTGMEYPIMDDSIQAQ